jgi:hypothetical protein
MPRHANQTSFVRKDPRLIGNTNPAKRPDVRKKISLALKGKVCHKGPKNPMYGKKRPDTSLMNTLRKYKHCKPVMFTSHFKSQIFSMEPDESMSLDYIAGFFDGEGSVHFAINRNNETASGFRIAVYVTISQKNPEILFKIRDFLGFGVIHKDRNCYRLQISGLFPCYRFISLMQDRVYVKREQIIFAKQALQLYPGPGRIWRKEDFLKLLNIISISRKLIGRPKSNKYNINDIIKEVKEAPDYWEELRRRRLSQLALVQPRSPSGRYFAYL